VRRAASLGLGLAIITAVGACSSSSKSSSPASTTGSPPTSTTVPGPVEPSAKIELDGPVGLAGPASEQGVRCNFPDLDGVGIAVLAVPPDGTSLARIALRPGRVKVIVGTGDGPDYHERAFEGAGVTSIDPARHAVVDSTLTETAATTGSTKGSIGVLTSIKGSVECGDQTPGTSTVSLTGTTREGTLVSAVLDPVRVECDPTADGDELAASGLVQIGATKALVSIGLTSDGAVTVDEALPSGSHRYVSAGTATVTSTGAHVRADVVEQNAPPPAHRLHVEGDFTCGRNAAG
jgi:hypothetical protein